MVTTAVLGFPRVGPDRELKFALEAFWRSELPAGGELGARRARRSRRSPPPCAPGRRPTAS